MIDEDLYQQATDELNSDKRRPHIWARACALASDDHDEARYLYTNLRVEELIAERDGETSELHPAADGSQASDYQYDATLMLEPLEPNEDTPESISAPSGVDQSHAREEILTLNTEMRKNNELIDSIERKSFEEKFDSREESEADSDSIDVQDENAYSDEFLDETINLTSELDGTAVFELNKGDATQFDSENHDEESVANEAGTVADVDDDDELEALLGGVYQGSTPPPPSDPLADDDTGAAMTLDFSEVTSSQGELEEISDDNFDENLEWLDDDLPPEEDNQKLQPLSPQISTDKSPNETQRLAQKFAQELERQADELPGQRSDIVAVNNGQEEFSDDMLLASAEDEHEIVSGDTFDEEAERDIAASQQRKQASQSPLVLDDEVDDSLAQHDLEDDADVDEHAPKRDIVGTSDLPAAAAMAAAGVAAASHATARSALELPVDLSEQHSGSRYTVFRRGDQAQAVKNGVSWPALFLTLPYLVYRHMFGTAMIYGTLWLIVLGGLLISGLAWLDAGTAASTIVKYTTAGFALLALIGLLYLPFRFCNQWREDKLEQRGFELVAWVRASSPGKAISVARQAATLD